MILDGKIVKEVKLNELKDKRIENINLVVIQVGEDKASSIYIKQKEKLCNYVGYGFNHIKLSDDISEEDLLNLIYKLNIDDDVTGILVQLPLPNHIDSVKVLDKINPDKDVDCLTSYNLGRLLTGRGVIAPCTPQGVMTLLQYYGIDISGKNVVIVGRSNLVGKPLSLLMTNKNATVTLCHSKTINLKDITKSADILVSAIGKPKFITKEYVKEGSTIIDVGINRLNDGKIVGDTDFENIKDIVANITPVPGGIGPMTILELANNLYKLKEESYTKKLTK